MQDGKYWNGRKVALLGGASLIGVHLGKALIEAGAMVKVVDDMSAGKLGNCIQAGIEKIVIGDLRSYKVALKEVKGFDTVFHLAAQHGGRGYVATHDVELYDNLALDTTIFRACAEAKVEKVIFSSSACAYPIDLQTDPNLPVFLFEHMIKYGSLQQPDGAYGTEKLIGEQILDAYIVKGLFKGCATRSFTVYGELMTETHAICALIAKSMIHQEPFEIWGSGRQIRNWTHVEDNVRGAMLAAEKLDRGAINIGTEERLTPIRACEIIWDYIKWHPKEIVFREDKPTGPLNRVAESSKLRTLGWRPQVSFEEGIQRTVDWYYRTHNPEQVKKELERKLTER